MQEKNISPFGEIILADEIDHAGHCLAAVYGIKQNSFGSGEELHGFNHALKFRALV